MLGIKDEQDVNVNAGLQDDTLKRLKDIFNVGQEKKTDKGDG